jgi:hypothetical protein
MMDHHHVSHDYKMHGIFMMYVYNLVLHRPSSTLIQFFDIFIDITMAMRSVIGDQ